MGVIGWIIIGGIAGWLASIITGTNKKFGIFYNILIAFIFCYWAWTRIALVAPMNVASLATMMIPVVGVFSGVLFLGEVLRWNDYAALIMVVAALSTVLIPPRQDRRQEAAGTTSRQEAGGRRQ